MLPDPFSALARTAVRRICFGDGERIFSVDQRSDGFFYVASGEVHMIRHTVSGNRVIIHRAYAGDFFAEASLFSETYHCDAGAVSATEVCKIDKKATLVMMDNSASFSRAVSASFARQIQAYRRLMELRSIQSAKDRVYAAVSDGWLQGNIMTFASQIGLSHEATYRALAALARSNRLVKAGRGDYRITDASR